MMDYSVFLVLVVIVHVVMCQQFSHTAVDSPQGTIHGRAYAGAVNVYGGIPYAKPPIGSLRLKPPQSLTYDTKAHINASTFAPSCPQDTNSLNTTTDEDCLYLNVYTPNPNPKNLPVMFWIHGGAFTQGSGSIYDGTKLAAKGQVIVVTINYRLGVLGFFPNGGTESTLGLQDQIMALQWVQKMIGSFGGNPNEVTIFGESAGGASVSLLSVSPRAKGLFKRVIAQSGVATSSWVIIPGNAQYKMGIITKAVRDAGCQLPVMECLKYAGAKDLVQLTNLIGMTQPEIDNDVIKADYATNLGLVHPGLEFVMGTLPNEGAMSIYMSCTKMYTQECNVYQGMDAKVLESIGQLPYGLDADQSTTVIKHYNNWYPYGVQSGNMNMLAATKLGTDRGYKIPTNRTASDLYSAGFKVHVYEFNSVPAFTLMPAVPWSTDAQHTDELAFIFPMPMSTDAVKVQVSDNTIKMWTDFAKGQLSEMTWPRFTTGRGQYLYIDDSHPSGQVRAPFFAEIKNAFWRNYFTHGVFPPFNDYTTASAGIMAPTLFVFIVFLTVVVSQLNL